MQKHLLTSSYKTDNELFFLLKKGDENAFEIIYDRYHKLLNFTAFKYMKDCDSSRDAVQQVFLKLWESKKELHIRISLKNYLYTILRNQILNEIRKNNTILEKYHMFVQNKIDYEDVISSKLEEKEMIEQLYLAIEELPKQKKEVCLYKIKESLSNQEIADKMQLSIPTIKSHYSQAIKLLRKHFERL